MTLSDIGSRPMRPAFLLLRARLHFGDDALFHD